MSKPRHVYVFAYDIHNDHIRRRVADILDDVAARVQYSVFEGRMRKAVMEQTRGRLSRLLEDGDSLRIYRLDERNLAASSRIGGAPFPEHQEFWLL